MGLVNPAVCQSKDSWRWQTSNSEYGKFYVRINQREVSQEAQNECFKKCEELTNKLQEAKAQLEKLKLTPDRHICCHVNLHDEACQTSHALPRRDCTIATKPSPPKRKMYNTQKKNNFNRLDKHESHMLLDQAKKENAHSVKCERQKLPLLSLRNGRNKERDNGDQANEVVEHRKFPSGCGLRSLVSRSESRSSSSSGSAKDCEHSSPRERKIVQTQRGALKKKKESLIKVASDLRCTAAGGTNLPPSQRYNFYQNFGYGGQGAKTSKGWHSLKNPWMPS